MLPYRHWLLLMLLLTPLGAQDSIGPLSTLQELLQFAGKSSPALLAARQTEQADLEAIDRVASLPDPRISYGYFLRPVETRLGPQQQRLGITQNIPWPGKLGLRRNIAAEKHSSSIAQTIRESFNLYQHIAGLYYQLAFNRQAQGILGNNIQLLEELDAALQTRYRSGTTTYSQLLEIQIERELLNNRLTGLGHRRKALQFRLNSLLNRPIDAPLPQVELPEKAISIPARPRLLEALAKNNPVLKQSFAQLRMQEHAVALARRDPWPDLTLGVDYIFTGSAVNPDLPESGRDAVAATIGISIPLWWGKHRAAIQEARARQGAASSQLLQQQNELAATLDQSLQQLMEARERIELYTTRLLPLAQEAVSVTRAGFETGSIDFQDMIKTQRTALELQLSHADALLQYYELRSALEALVAQPLSTGGTTHE